MRGIRFVRLFNRSRGIGIRIAAITMLLVVISMVIPAIIISSYLDKALEQHVSERIGEEMAHLLGDNANRSPRVVIAEVKQRTQSALSSEFSYHIVTRTGQHIAGDARIKVHHIGWDKTTAPDPENAGKQVTEMLILTAPLGNELMITVGREVRWIGTVELKLRDLMMWGLLGGIILAAVTAYLVNRLIAGRLDIISDTAVAIMDGNLSHRMPLTGADDDFDRLSATLNTALNRIQ